MNYTKNHIVMIGAGCLSWHLAPALDSSGFSVGQVYNRHPRKAHKLTERLYQAEVVTSLNFSECEASLYILAIQDDALEEVARQLIVPSSAFVVHTSGSHSINVLSSLSTPHIGVFYPLQSFSWDTSVDFHSTPIFIEAASPECQKKLSRIGKALSEQVHYLHSKDRLWLHLAAVFANNFTNHMLTITHQLMQKKSMNFEWMYPLIRSSYEKSMQLGPHKAQTGPASRKDFNVLEKHMDLLREHTDLTELYQLISQQILDPREEDDPEDWS